METLTCVSTDSNLPEQVKQQILPTPDNLQSKQCWFVKECDESLYYFQTNDKKCEYLPNCKIFNKEKKECEICEDLFILSRQKKCEKPCFFDKSITCLDLFKLDKRKTTIYIQDFQSQHFSSLYVESKNFTVKFRGGTPIEKGTSTITTICDDVSLILGYLFGEYMAEVILPKYQINEEYFYLSFEFFLIDPFSSDQTKILLVINKNFKEEIYLKTKGIFSHYCGQKIKDFQGRYQLHRKLSYPKEDLNISIQNNSKGTVSFGIRSIYLIGYNCTDPNCLDCELLGCKTCKAGYRLNDLQVCKKCLDSSMNINNADCPICSQLCSECAGPHENQCKRCEDNAILLNGDTCQYCVQEWYYDHYLHQCNKCQLGCKKCVSKDSCITCLEGFVLQESSCVECLTEFSSKKDCTKCIEGMFIQKNKKCEKCKVLNCSTCDQYDDGNSCKICMEGFKYKPVEKKCEICETSVGWFIREHQCLKCHDSCKTCTGELESDCLIYEDNYYQQVTGNCKLFHIIEPLQLKTLQIESHCKDFKLDCSDCSNSFETFLSMMGLLKSSANGQCISFGCLTCQDNYSLFNGKCVSNCREIGNGFLQRQTIKQNQCECRPDQPYLIQTESNLECVSTIPFGYICSTIQEHLTDKEKRQYCYQCQASCEKCESEQICARCLPGSFLWKGECRSSCFPSLEIIQNEQNRTCECNIGLIMKQRSETEKQVEENGNLKNEEFICLRELKLIKVELVNAMSSMSFERKFMEERDNFSEVKNYFILTYNRSPTEEEFSSFSFHVLSNGQQRNQDYRVESITQGGNENRQKIIIEISVYENRSISDILIIMENASKRIYLSDAILLSEESSKAIQSSGFIAKSVSAGMEQFSSSLINPHSEGLRLIIDFSKKFQFLCLLSNFVQLLTPIYLISYTLPRVVRYGSLLGASFIFESIPSTEQLSFVHIVEDDAAVRVDPLSKSNLDSQNNQQKQQLTEQEQEKSNYSRNNHEKANNTTTNDYFLSTSHTISENKQQTLGDILGQFGVDSNIFSISLGVDLVLFSGIFLILICYIGRISFTGKQYTMLVMHKVSNFMVSSMQSSITLITFKIAYCLSYNSGKDLIFPIIYSIVYIAFYLNIYFITLFLSADYLFTNIPNFFVDINHKYKGAKWYLWMSACKKHASIVLLLTLFPSPGLCCILISGIFVLSAISLLYFRFFYHSAITVAKIIQELAIAQLFGLIVFTAAQFQEIKQKNVIDQADLIRSIELGSAILISMQICIVISCLFSIYRLVRSVKKLINAWQAYRAKAKIAATENQGFPKDETVLELQQSSIQYQNNSNSVSFQVQQLFSDRQEYSNINQIKESQYI